MSNLEHRVPRPTFSRAVHHTSRLSALAARCAIVALSIVAAAALLGAFATASRAQDTPGLQGRNPLRPPVEVSDGALAKMLKDAHAAAERCDEEAFEPIKRSAKKRIYQGESATDAARILEYIGTLERGISACSKLIVRNFIFSYAAEAEVARKIDREASVAKCEDHAAIIKRARDRATESADMARKRREDLKRKRAELAELEARLRALQKEAEGAPAPAAALREKIATMQTLAAAARAEAGELEFGSETSQGAQDYENDAKVWEMFATKLSDECSLGHSEPSEKR
jgi:hypothetical protein